MYNILITMDHRERNVLVDRARLPSHASIRAMHTFTPSTTSFSTPAHRNNLGRKDTSCIAVSTSYGKQSSDFRGDGWLKIDVANGVAVLLWKLRSAMNRAMLSKTRTVNETHLQRRNLI